MRQTEVSLVNNKPNTIKDLKQLLIKAKIPELYYNVPSDDMFFCDTVTYLKIKNNDGFEIGVFERGTFHDVHIFDTEAEACQAFLERYYPEALDDKKMLVIS